MHSSLDEHLYEINYVLSIHFDCDHSLVTFQLLGYLWGILDNTKSSRSWQLSEAPF
jgi:hypothetical protein